MPIRLIAALALALLLGACGTTGTLPPGGFAAPSNWDAGPTIDGINRSPCTPAVAAVGGGLALDIPPSSFAHSDPGQPDDQVTQPACSTHYVTIPYGSLTGKTGLHLRAHADVPDGETIAPKTSEGGPSLLTLYFQRCGDDWTAEGKHETDRWYATAHTVMPIAAGDYDIVARFDDRWTAILTSASDTSPAAFADALAHACRVGFVLGGGDGLGHGVYTQRGTVPARLTFSFAVE